MRGKDFIHLFQFFILTVFAVIFHIPRIEVGCGSGTSGALCPLTGADLSRTVRSLVHNLFYLAEVFRRLILLILFLS